MKHYYLMHKPNLKPKTKAELQEQIYYEMSKHGNNCNLNHIDVSNVNNMSSLFESTRFNGDISKWDVSNITCMINMFDLSLFTQDLSKWNVTIEDYANIRNMFGRSPMVNNEPRWYHNIKSQRKNFYSWQREEFYRNLG